MKKKLAAAVFAALFACCLFCSCMLVPGHGTEPSETPPQPAGSDGRLSFTASDVNGDSVDFSDYSDKKLVMINFWETWCGPCRGEIPDLEELYEKYRDEGFMLIGVYSDSGEDDVKAMIESVGITYPNIPIIRELRQYTTRYVPTTVFFDGEGNQLGGDPVIGALDKAQWEELIRSYLYR